MNCTLCKTPGHGARHCPELRSPLLPGFHTGGNGGGGHDHDEDACADTLIKCPNPMAVTPPQVQ
jgi:hypothetical protein